jgi:AbrB family looped-hinge helix DNA binding protein
MWAEILTVKVILHMFGRINSSMEKQKVWTYKVEDVFADIPDDPANVTMTIPEPIRDEIGLKEGDSIKVSVGDKGTLIIEKV